MDRIVRGIVPVLQTPLKNRKVDVASLERHVNFLCTKDIGGLWVLGTGSEDMHLTLDQRVVVAQTACNTNRGRKPLFLGCSFYSMGDTERFLLKTSDLSWDAYHYMPYHPLVSWGRLLVAYSHLARMVPLWAYSSANWFRSMPVGFVESLRSEGLSGIKFSSQKTSDIQNVIALVRPGFQVITAVATQFLACLQMGARASTTSVAGVYPEPFIELYCRFRGGGDAMGMQGEITRLVNGMKATKEDNFLGGAEEKALLKRMGIYETEDMTFPYRGLTNDERKRLFESQPRLHQSVA